MDNKIKQAEEKLEKLEKEYRDAYELYRKQGELVSSLKNTNTSEWVGKYIYIKKQESDGFISVSAGLVDYVATSYDGSFVFSKEKKGFSYYEINGKITNFEIRDPYLDLEDIREGYKKPEVISKEEYYKRYNEALERIMAQVKEEEKND